MKKRKLYIFILLLLFKFNITQGQNIDKVLQHIKCLDIVKEYKEFWDGDSLGNNGFRLITGEKFLKKCDFKGLKWTDLIKVLGKPNHSFTFNKVEIYHRYNLWVYKKELGAPGNLLLEFTVKNNLVISFSFTEIDG